LDEAMTRARRRSLGRALLSTLLLHLLISHSIGASLPSRRPQTLTYVRVSRSPLYASQRRPPPTDGMADGQRTVPEGGRSGLVMKAPVENKDVLREGLAVGGGILMGMMAASGPAAAAGLTQMPLSQTDQFPLDFSEPFILAGTTIVGSALIFAAAVAVRYAQIQNERATLQEQQQQQQQQQPIKVAEETAASTTPPPPAAGGAEVIAPPPQEAANESVEVPPALMKAAQQEESAPWVEPETPPPPPLKKLEAKKEPSAPVTSAPESPRTAAQTPPTAVQPPEPIAEPPAAPPAGAKVAVAGEGAYVMDADRAKWERWSRLSEEEVQAEMEREMQEEEEAEQRRREDLAKVEAQVKPYKIDMMNRGRAEIQQRSDTATFLRTRKANVTLSYPLSWERWQST